MFLHFSPSHRSSPPVHPLNAVLFNAAAIYRRRGDARHCRRFHEWIRIRETYSTFLRFLVSISPTKWILGWTRHISQRKHPALSSSRADSFVRARRDYLCNEKHSSCCLLLLANFLLKHRHGQIVRIFDVYYLGVSRETFWEMRYLIYATLKY